MGIEFFTGFEGCGSLSDMRTMFDLGTNAYYVSTGGFNNSKSAGGNNNLYLWTSKFVPKKTICIGWHVRNAISVTYSTDANRHLLRLAVRDSGGTYLGVIRFFNTSSGILIYRDATLIATCPYLLPSDITHIQIKAYSHDTAGYVHIRINGNTVAVYEGESLNLFDGNFYQVLWGCMNNSSVRLDNLFISDDWEGELNSNLILPTQDSSVAFSPSSGTDNYAMIAEASHDSDATYVESDVLNAKDIYEYSNISLNTLVKGYTCVTVPRKTDTGSRNLKTLLIHDSVEYELGEAVLQIDYPSVTETGVWYTNSKAPDDTILSAEKINSFKFGYQVA